MSKCTQAVVVLGLVLSGGALSGAPAFVQAATTTATTTDTGTTTDSVKSVATTTTATTSSTTKSSDDAKKDDFKQDDKSLADTASTTSTTTDTASKDIDTLTASSSTSTSSSASPRVLVTTGEPSALSTSQFTTSDLNGNGIADNTEAVVLVATSTTLSAGEYQFNELRVLPGVTLTLQSNPSAGSGVRIQADSVIVEAGSYVSADGTGYVRGGPGTPDNFRRGASHGGVGLGGSVDSWYGSSLWPRTLGSNSSGGAGGGALELVAEKFINNGNISANGDHTASGGSILMRTRELVGDGVIQAEGGDTKTTAFQLGAGAGGRIALHVEQYEFDGTVSVRGGRRSGNIFPGAANRYAESGTAVHYVPTANALRPIGRYRIQENDAPHEYAELIIHDQVVEVESNTSLTATTVQVTGAGQLRFSPHTVLNAETVLLQDEAQVFLAGTILAPLQALRLGNTAQVLVEPVSVLELDVAELSIAAGAVLSLDGAGYNIHDIVPYETSAPGRSGASHGGAGRANTATSTYGDAATPTTFGTGGTFGRRGGGVLKLTAQDIQLDGHISASGEHNSSGGSIWVTTHHLAGMGSIAADGGGFGVSAVSFRPGGGGRVALYYGDASAWTGTITAQGGIERSSIFNNNRVYAEDGSIVFDQIDIPPTCEENCNSNVLFLPGIMGSHLYEESEVCDGFITQSEQQRWFSMNDCDQLRMLTDDSGQSLFDIYTKPETASVVATTLGFNLYKSFIKDLATWEAEGIIADSRIVPYDWRLRLDDILKTKREGDRVVYDATISYQESYLYQMLEELVASSRTGKVTVVTHSNGGLLAKHLLSVMEKNDDPLLAKVDNLVLVAVPQAGTPSALLGLLHGDSLGPLGLITSQQTARTLMNTAPFAYHLLPTASYFVAVSTPVATFADTEATHNWRDQYGEAIVDSHTLAGFTASSDREKPAIDDLLTPEVAGNGLLQYASEEHFEQAMWLPPAGMQVYQVVGTGVLTPTTLEYFTDYKCTKRSILQFFACTETEPVLGYRVVHARDGDATVASPSAGMMAESDQVERWWVNLEAYNEQNFSRVHRDILEVPDTRDFIFNIIQDTDLATNFQYLSDPEPLLPEADRIEFTLHSPLDLQILSTDGVVSSSSVTIAGAMYRRYGEVQYVSIPSSTENPQLVLTGQGSGSFTLEVERIGGSAENITFSALPTATSTVVTASVPDNVPDIRLALDSAGDGNVDSFAKLTEAGDVQLIPVVKESEPEPENVRGSTSSSGTRILSRITPAGAVAGVSSGELTPAQLEELQRLLNELQELIDIWSSLYE